MDNMADNKNIKTTSGGVGGNNMSKPRTNTEPPYHVPAVVPETVQTSVSRFKESHLQLSLLPSAFSSPS